METIKVEHEGDPEAEQDLHAALAAEGFDLTRVADEPSDRAFVCDRGFSAGRPSPVMFLVQTTLASYSANHPDMAEHTRSALRRALTRFHERRPKASVSGPDDLIPR